MSHHERPPRPETATRARASVPPAAVDPAFHALVRPLQEDPAWRRRVRGERVLAALRRTGWSAWAAMGRLGCCFASVPSVPRAGTRAVGAPTVAGDRRVPRT